VHYVGGPFVCLDPLYLLEPALGSRDLAVLPRRLLLAGLGWTAVTAGGLALAAWRLRPAYLRQYLEGRDPITRRRATAHPPVGADPVRWKERYVGRLSVVPLLWLLPRWVGVVLVGLASLGASASTFSGYLPAEATPAYLLDKARSGDVAALAAVLDRTDSPGFGFLAQGLLVLLLAALLVNLRGAGGISGEREKGTWDALLLAGMSARAMVRGKLLGIIEWTYPYLIAYAVPALLLGGLGGLVSLLAVLGTLALTWPAMYLSGAVALERSTRYPSPWRAATASLVMTTLLVGGLVYTPLSFILPMAMTLSLIGGGPWGGVVAMLCGATFIGWLMLRVARDYVRLGANAIKEGRGELPDKEWLPSFRDKEAARRRERRRYEERARKEDEARSTPRRPEESV
jgi:hypothetical protein